MGRCEDLYKYFLQIKGENTNWKILNYVHDWNLWGFLHNQTGRGRVVGPLCQIKVKYKDVSQGLPIWNPYPSRKTRPTPSKETFPTRHPCHQLSELWSRRLICHTGHNLGARYLLLLRLLLVVRWLGLAKSGRFLSLNLGRMLICRHQYNCCHYFGTWRQGRSWAGGFSGGSHQLNRICMGTNL